MIARGALLLVGLIVAAVEWAVGLVAEVTEALSGVLAKAELQRLLWLFVALPALAASALRLYRGQLDSALLHRGRYRRVQRLLASRYRALRRQG